MFSRNITSLNSTIALPGELTLDFVSLGASAVDPFPFIVVSMLNPSEATTYDFETEEVSGVCTIKYLHNGGVVHKQEMTDIIVSSPILSMQDLFSPIAYLYPDDTNLGYPNQPDTTKSGRQEINYLSSIRLPVIEVDADGLPMPEPNLGGVHRFAIKGNWHFLASSILCDTISVFVRRRIKSGVLIQAYNFL